jgi:GT2 family glycosyltransferase
LAEVTRGHSFEVIVVDNASIDGTADFLAQLNGDVQIIRNDENLGFAKACNQGARAARGRYLLFLNNDTVPLAGWLEPLVAELEMHPDVAVVGSKLLYEDGTVQHAGVAFSRAHFGPYHIYRGVPGDVPFVNERREYQCVTAACMLIRRETFEAVGTFDEGYVNGFEDVDLCLKIRERGGRIVYQPRSVLFHLESRTPGRHAHEVENSRRLFARWSRQWWLVDEDAICVGDGYAFQVSEEGNTRRGQLSSLDDPAERARWQLVADTQRMAATRDVAALGALLARATEWPDDASVLRWGAELCERSGNGQYAEALWMKLATLGKEVSARRTLAQTALERDDMDEASIHLDALLNAAPTDATGWLLKGLLAARLGQPADATHAFETAAQHGADGEEVRAGMALVAAAADGHEVAPTD